MEKYALDNAFHVVMSNVASLLQCKNIGWMDGWMGLDFLRSFILIYLKGGHRMRF